MTGRQRPGKRYRIAALLTLALLLALAAACSPGATPTPTAVVPTPTEASGGQATETPAPPTPTEAAVETPTEAPTATEEAAASPTPAPVGNVGDYEWKQLGLAGQSLQDIALLPTGNNPALVTGPDGAWHSTYDYTNWQKLDVQMQGRTTTAAIGSPDVMYVTSHTGCASGAPIDAQRTANGGQSWQAISGQITPLNIAASSGTLAYGTTCSGVVKSTDGGATWTEIPGSRMENFDPAAIAASPDGQSIFVAHYSEGGVARINQSTDGGATWTEITPTGEELRAPILLFHVTGSVGRPDDGGLYMTSYPSSLWFLIQGGGAGEWKLARGGDPQSDNPETANSITALYVDTAYSEEYNKPGPVIYIAQGQVATANPVGAGVHRSTNGGMTWEEVGKGLGQRVVTGLALAPHDPFATPATVEMLLATTSDGVWGAAMPPPFR